MSFALQYVLILMSILIGTVFNAFSVADLLKPDRFMPKKYNKRMVWTHGDMGTETQIRG